MTTILVADDSDILRTLVRVSLTSQGWSVLEARTPSEAVDLARQHLPDAALMDIDFRVPDGDGIDACGQLKADARTRHIPIVILTAYDERGHRERARAAGADLFISKPFGPLELISTLHSLVPGVAEKPALGVLLLEHGAVAAPQLESALAEQRDLESRGVPRRLGELLVERGLVPPAELDRALDDQRTTRLTTGPSQNRVLIVDDHLAVREGVRALLAHEDDFEVVGEAVDAVAALESARRLRPSLIVLDNEMPGRNGIEIVPDLRRELPDAQIVMFTVDPSFTQRALAMGVDAVLAKDARMSQIMAALRSPRTAVLGGARPVRAWSGALPVFEVALRRWRRPVAVLGMLLLAYIGVFLITEPAIGASSGALLLVPIAVAGALFGPEAGLAMAVVALLVTFGLWSLTEHEVGEPVIRIGGGLGAVLALLLGMSAGSFRVLLRDFDARARRIDAIANAALSVSGVDRREFLDSWLAAMLRVSASDAALICTPRDGQLHVEMSAGAKLAGSAVVELQRRAKAVFDTRVPGNTDEAALLPIALPGGDVRGVLIFWRRQRPHFSERELLGLRPVAEYLGLRLAEERQQVEQLRQAGELTR